MAIQSLAPTTNFVVQYEDSLPNKRGLTRAQQVTVFCETEFAILCKWFDIADGFGPDNRIKVTLSQPDGSGAGNHGYMTGGATQIEMDAQDGNANDDDASEKLRVLFVLEFVEVLMSKRGNAGSGIWNFVNSHGEGLSQLCGLLRAPAAHAAYYSILGVNTYPWVNTWLTSTTRTDWITNPEATDKKPDSFGCALLFLYYLKSQLHFSIEEIVQKGGGTLEATYSALTGKSGANTAFRALIDPYFPIGKTPPLATNDPFPLLSGPSRRVNISPEKKAVDRLTFRVPMSLGEATISPTPFCPKKTYRYSISRAPIELICTASTLGFGQPIYSWIVHGGVALSTATGKISRPVNLKRDAPAAPQGVVAEPGSIEIDFTIMQPDVFTSVLTLSFPGTYGHFDLIIEADAVEKFASRDSESGFHFSKVDTSTVFWEPRYYMDKAECEKHLSQLLSGSIRYDPLFQIWKTLPDPPPDARAYLGQVAAIAEAVQSLEHVGTKDRELIREALAERVGLTAAQFRALGEAGRSK